jgi:hypothetical protein
MLASNVSVGALTVLGSSLFWNPGQVIMKVPTTGGTPTALVTDSSIPQAELATDGTRLYFMKDGVPGEIDAINPDGSGQTMLYSGALTGGGVDGVSEMFIVGSTLYLNEGIGVFSLPLAGGTPQEIVMDSFELLAADASSLYMLTQESMIGFTPLAGGTPMTFGAGPSPIELGMGGQFASVGGTLYYLASAGPNQPLSLMKLAPPSTSPTTVKTLMINGPNAQILGDANGLYAEMGNAIYQIDPSSGALTTLYKPFANLQKSGAFAMDAKNLYFVETGNLYALPR